MSNEAIGYYVDMLAPALVRFSLRLPRTPLMPVKTGIQSLVRELGPRWSLPPTPIGGGDERRNQARAPA
jgi:hypothetical protein